MTGILVGRSKARFRRRICPAGFGTALIQTPTFLCTESYVTITYFVSNLTEMIIFLLWIYSGGLNTSGRP